MVPNVAVSLPSLVTRWRPLGAWTGHCCLLAVYSTLTPAVQLLDTTFLYLGVENDRKIIHVASCTFTHMERAEGKIKVLILIVQESHTVVVPTSSDIMAQCAT